MWWLEFVLYSVIPVNVLVVLVLARYGRIRTDNHWMVEE